MSLSPGQRLGSFEILEALGAGGQGEVYRARDTALGREVAVKALPEAFAKDEARLARFEREAKLLAALNHSGIATLYGVERTGEGRFLVMELVEGETLAEMFARGALPFDEALPLFRQIALALESAHEKGIVHRDLKPANVKVTPGGTVKLLDFGLAKLAESESSPTGDGGSLSPTLTKDTALGTILGTASYMSPEQARGKVVDARTDVWGFGCCLYEALAGKKAFDGETATDTIAALVKQEPDWSALPPDTPAHVRSVLARCLRKDTARRIHSVADARIELEEESSSAAEPPRRRVALAFTAGAVLATLATVPLFWGGRSPRPASELKRVTIQVPETDEVMFGHFAPAISPDGRFISYVGRREAGPLQIFLRPLDRFETVAVQGTEGVESSPLVSPDSQWLAFLANGTLKKIPIAGGIPVTLAKAPNFLSGAWEEEGSLVLANLKEVRRFEASGNASEVILQAEKEERMAWPMLLPGGNAVLYTSLGPRGPAVGISRLDTGERRILVEEGSGSQYVKTGHILFAHEDVLLSAPLDLERLELVGPPIPVVEGVRSIGGGFRAQFGVSGEGTLLYVPATAVRRGLAELVWVDRTGAVEPLSAPRRTYGPHPRLSPDGRTLAVAHGGEDGTGSEIWLLEIGREALTRLTSASAGFSSRPFWTPDGSNLVFGAAGYIVSKRAGGSGDALRLSADGNRVPSWVTSDGKGVLFRQNSDSRDIGLLPLDGKSEAVMLLDSSFNEHSGVLSPDDRWLAYVSDESGQDEVYLCTFPGLEGRKLVSTDGGAEPLFSRDGKELFYRSGDRMMAVRILSTHPEIELSRPEILFEGSFQSGVLSGNPGLNYDVASDGRFVMIRDEGSRKETSLHVVFGWFEELKRLVPHPSPP